jgi:hypothetical protein
VKTSRIAIAALAIVGMSAASLAIVAPAEAVTTVHLTKSLTGFGTWPIPSTATNIVATLSSAQGTKYGGAGGSGGSAGYALANSAAGSTLSYLVGTLDSGNLPRPIPIYPNTTIYPTGGGGGGTAIAIGATVLAVVGGGGGGAGSVVGSNTAGGAGGVATSPGVAVGGDGESIPGFTAAGQGGQAAGGGVTPPTAHYAGSAVYAGSNGENGPAWVSGGVITLAKGGYGPYLGGAGGSGYTGGAGGTDDVNRSGVYDRGAGGGGSGYLASSGISYVGGSSASHAGAGSLVITYDAPQLQVVSKALVGGDAGQSYTWSPATITTGSAPYGYALASGSTLPAGLTLSPTAGSISGTPAATGTKSFSVVVTDATDQTASLPLQITIGTLTVTAPSQVKIGGVLTLSGSGYDAGSYDVKLDGATSPVGTASADALGALTFTGTVPIGSTSGTHSIGVYRGGILVASASVRLVASLVANATAAPSAYQGQDFSWTPLATTGGTLPLTYAIDGPLPAGLFWNAATGSISGIPTAETALSTAFSVDVTDASPTPQSQTVAFTLGVGALSFTAPASAVIGTTITLTGAGFQEGDYSVELHSSPVVLGTVHVDATHTLSFTGTIPAGFDPGVHQLQVLHGGVLVSTSTITIAAAPVKVAVIASTGFDAGPALLLALLLVTAGLVVTATGRLRRRRASWRS